MNIDYSKFDLYLMAFFAVVVSFSSVVAILAMIYQAIRLDMSESTDTEKAQLLAFKQLEDSLRKDL